MLIGRAHGLQPTHEWKHPSIPTDIMLNSHCDHWNRYWTLMPSCIHPAKHQTILLTCPSALAARPMDHDLISLHYSSPSTRPGLIDLCALLATSPKEEARV
ncbi:hypothetical protein XFEB_01902 [Xylella fastidiosa EB92.1]|nr:hypothetical protein XFEB_01902 [Xylella fastidiosa EB92.1]